MSVAVWYYLSDTHIVLHSSFVVLGCDVFNNSLSAILSQ